MNFGVYVTQIQQFIIVEQDHIQEYYKFNQFEQYLDVFLEIPNSAIHACITEMIVDPSDQDLFRRQLLQVLGGFSILQEIDETRVVGKVDIAQQTNLPNKSFQSYFISSKKLKANTLCIETLATIFDCNKSTKPFKQNCIFLTHAITSFPL